MTERSSRREVRNPILALPALKDLQELPGPVRAAIAGLLADIATTAHERAQHSWKANKGPMAVYWKSVGVYATHIRRAVKP